jgi:hypothetical protein
MADFSPGLNLALHQRYNNEDIFTRAIIAGLLDILNNKISYQQVWTNEYTENIAVPWYYNMSGDERFMQDFYTFYGSCLAPRPVDGNFDMIPRGIVTYTGSIIDSVRTTSRYVQGNYLKEVNGQLQTFRSFLYSIPLNINFACEIWTDTQITSLKIEQLIREVFYKTITFYVYYKGMRIGCTVGFPEDIALEKNIQYAFESNNNTVPKIKFNLQVESYQPVFDPTTEVNANDYITGIGYRLIDRLHPKHDGIIVITSPADGTDDNPLIVPKGYPLWIEWDYTKENAIINRINAYWLHHNNNERHLIEQLVPNHEYYIWNIPETFTNYRHPVIIWSTDSSVSVYREPNVRIIPDTSTGDISANSFMIVDKGYFLSPLRDMSVNAVLEMRNDSGGVVYSNDGSLYFNLVGNKLDSVVLPDGPIRFPGTVDYKLIDIQIANSVNPEVYDVIQNIKIV